MRNKLYLFGLIATIVFVLAMIVTGGPLFNANAAPLGAPTPVVFSNNGARANPPRDAAFFDGTPVAALTPVTNCYDMREYSIVDLTFSAAQAQTITMTLLHGPDATHLATGQTLINASSTPVATTLQQYPLYGIQQCIKLQAANGTPVSVYARGLGK